MKTTLAVILAALTLAGCGRAGTGTSPSPQPTFSPGPGFNVVVTEKDHSAALRTGQKLEVVLHPYSGMTTWTQVKSSDPSILRPIVDPAATAAKGVTVAAFQALAPGEADITALSAPYCGPGQACPMYVAIFTIMVTVTS